MVVALVQDAVLRCKEQISNSQMALDELRKKVIYQNSVDVWIGICHEKEKNWNDPQRYKQFIEFLQNNQVSMKKFPLCISESDSASPEKIHFSESLSNSQDPLMETFTIKLNDNTLDIIRKFPFNI